MSVVAVQALMAQTYENLGYRVSQILSWTRESEAFLP